MAVQFSNELLDGLIAPGVSTFNKATIPDLEVKIEEDHWLSNLFLNSVISRQYTHPMRQAVVSFIFRTQNGRREYNSAKGETLRCTASWQSGRPNSIAYLNAVRHWETVILNVQIAIDLHVKVFDKSTVVTDEVARITKIANRIKHYAEDIDLKKNSDKLTLPVWLAPDGLVARTASATYAEIAEILDDMGLAADELQNPTG